MATFLKITSALFYHTAAVQKALTHEESVRALPPPLRGKDGVEAGRGERSGLIARKRGIMNIQRDGAEC